MASDADKGPTAYRTISEVADELGVAQHVLRFWETKFRQVTPLKRGGNRRYYRPDDVALLKAINRLLYSDGYTIKGVQKLLKDRGARAVISGTGGEDGEGAALAPSAAATGPVTGLFSGAQPADPDRPTALVSELRMLRQRLAAALAAA